MGIWNDLEKAYGEKTTIFGAEEDHVLKCDTYGTGSHILNNAIGIGGLPAGRLIQFAGKASSGKTLLSLLCIAEHQRRDPKNEAVFIDAEYTFDKDWAQKLGVDLSRLKVIKENSGQKIFELLIGIPAKEIGKKKQKAGLLDMIIEGGGAKETGIGIIVLDSIASIQPPIAETKAVGHINMAPMGRFMSETLPKLTPLLSKSGVAFIAVNQVRVNPGQMFGNPETSPGGNAWRHYCSLMVHMTALSSKENQITNELDEQIGHYVSFKIDKNKVAQPFKKGKFAIEYLKGISREYEEIVDVAITHNIIHRPNNVMYEYGEQKWKGRDNVNQAVLENEELKNELLNKIYAQIGATEEVDASTMSE